MLIINDDLHIPLRELNFTFARSSGPGGQNVNKVNTKATLRWQAASSPSLPEDVRQRFVERFSRRITKQGEIIVTSQRFRDQGRNVADCLSKLREMVAEAAVAPPPRKPKKKPTKAARQRRLDDKRRRSKTKQLRKSPKEW